MNSSTSSFKRGGKRIAADLLLFVFFLFLFDRSLFWAIREGESLFYSGASFHSLQEKFSLVKDKDAYRVLILGTSRTYDGIHPWYIQKELGIKAFKEAFVGKGPMYNYFFYQEYRKSMGIPQVVIYGVDYFLFNINSERHWLKRFNNEQIGSLYFGRGVSLLLANKPQIDEFINALLNDLKNSTVSDNNFLIEKDNTQMENYQGVVSPGTIDGAQPPRFRKVSFFNFPGKEGSFFAKLLDVLQRDDVTVILVSLPEYIGTFWTNRNHRKFNLAFKYFAKKYENVHFLNYNNPRMFDLSQASYFIDGGYGKTNSHLSRAGSEVFNRLLVHDLRRFLRKK